MASRSSAEFHGLDAPVERDLGILDVLERIRLLLFVMHVQVDQLPAGLGEGVEIGRLARKRDPRQLAFQVLRETVRDIRDGAASRRRNGKCPFA